MINKSRLLIRKLIAVLGTADLTNTEDRKSLAEEYCTLCEEYNRLAEECQKMADQNMLIDACRQIESKDLKRIGEILLFPDRDLLLDMCTMYHWKKVNNIQLGTIRMLMEKSAGSVDIVNLVNHYRQVMRTDNREEKIRILRQICIKDPKQEWKDTLAVFEKEWLTELLDQAKEAILKKDELQVQKLGEILNDPRWMVKPPAAALKKISAEVERYHQEDLNRQARLFSEQISNALSSFDFDAMTYELTKWDHFVEAENYAVPDDIRQQVEEARRWFMQESAVREKQKAAEDLIGSLQQALENPDVTVEELDDSASKLQMMEWEIPEGIRTRYQTIRTELLTLQSRRKKIIIAAASLAVAAVAALCSWGIYVLIMNMNEKAWCAQLQKTLDEKKPEAGLKLLDELEKKMPSIRKRVSVLEKENQLSEMKKSHDAQRELFTEQIALCREKLPQYALNSKWIHEQESKLSEMVLDSEMKSEFEKLSAEIETAKADADADIVKEYNRGIEKLDEIRKDFFLALEEKNLDKAKQYYLEAHDLHSKLQHMAGIDESVRKMNQKTLESVSELEGILKEKTEQAKREADLLRRMNNPESFPYFAVALEKLGKEFHADPDVADWLKFSERYLQLTSKVNEKNFSVLPGYQDGIAKIEEQNKLYSENLAKIREYIEGLSEGYRETPLYCIQARSEDVVCGAYYYQEIKPLRPKKDERIRFYALKNEMGGNRNREVIMIFFDGTYSASMGDTIRFQQAGASDFQNGKLIYPESLSRGVLPEHERNLAPHVILTHQLAGNVRKVNEKYLESFLIDSMKSLLSYSGPGALHPYPVLYIMKKLSETLAAVSGNEIVRKDILADITRCLQENHEWEYCWLQNTKTALDKYRSGVKTLNRIKKSVDELNVSPKGISRDFAQDFYAHPIRCTGYLMKDGEQWKLVSFQNALVNKELFILSENQTELKYVGDSPESVQNLEMKEEEKIVPVFASPGRSLKELESAYLEKAKRANVALEYPACWPLVKGTEK